MLQLHGQPLFLVPEHAPSFTETTSLMNKNMNKTKINGSNTSIQEIALNPLEHKKFKTHAQMTRNNALVKRVSTLNFLKAALMMPIAPKIRYSCAGVQ